MKEVSDSKSEGDTIKGDTIFLDTNRFLKSQTVT